MREDIEQALKKFEVKTFGSMKKIKAVGSLLSEDEKVLYISPTNVTITLFNTQRKERFSGVFVLTNRRILFHYHILFSSRTDSVELNRIHSIHCSGNGLTGGHLKIHTGTKTYDVRVSYKRERMNQILATFEAARNQYSQIQVTINTKPNVIQQIEMLAGLREKNILTEEEFQKQKQALLAKF